MELTGRKIAILATDGFEKSELIEPKEALEKTGAQVHVVSPKKGMIRSWEEGDWGSTVPVDRSLSKVEGEDYDALVLPGGVMNADYLRTQAEAVEFVSSFVEYGKPIAVICHGAWILIETGFVKHRRMTSWPSLRTDLENAGAEWLDEAVVVDNGWVSSRKPADLPEFCEKMIEEFSEGRHAMGFEGPHPNLF